MIQQHPEENHNSKRYMQPMLIASIIQNFQDMETI